MSAAGAAITIILVAGRGNVANLLRVWRELARDRTFNHNPPSSDTRPDRHATSTTVPPLPPAGFPLPDNCRAGVKSILDFARAKREEQPIVILAAYDALMARLLAASEVDAILVGDSAAMVVHGFPSTIHATVEMMCVHTAAVRRGAPVAVVIADMPFLSVRQGREEAVLAAVALMQAGATAVKIEGVAGHEEIIAHLVESGIPVMGHLGLTPQSVHQLGGFRLQGRTADAAARLTAEAHTLEKSGAFALVLECVPAALAADISRALAIPAIGIGAGPDTDGQVLVLADLLGLDAKFRPRFARRYLEGH
jgi:3-methyl-2-oxobutanoate hydroxymethyltransferase